MIVILLLTAAMTGIAWFTSDRLRAAQGFEADEGIDSGTVVRSEVIHLWLPETLAKLTSPQSQIVLNHEELRRFFEQRHQELPRYAMTVRLHLVNGRHDDIIFIFRSDEAPHYFQEYATWARGKQDRSPTLDFSGASVHIIPEELLSREMSVVMAELRNIQGELVTR